MPNETKAQDLCKQILKRCGPHSAEVILSGRSAALTRFANNAIHQNVAEKDLELMVRVFIGKRSGIASTNRTDPGSLDEVVRRAEALAKASPEDPDYPGLPEPQASAPVAAFDQNTADYTPEQRAEQVGLVCRLADKKNLNASGAFSTGVEEWAVANSLGMFNYHACTMTDFQTVVMAADASGRARATAWKVSDLDVPSMGAEAIRKAEMGRQPRPIEPGEYSVVFDPYVTEDLLFNLSVHGMGAQGVLDGRSWMNDLIGERVMDPRVSIWDDGRDPGGIPLPFDFEGMPRQRVEIVTDGVVKGPVYDRYTARKAGKTSTGHAVPPNLREYGPLALNLFMAPGSASTEEMIRTTERGLYITRFWYTRLVHPRGCVVTGMTRDGVFMIEHGELAYPVKNLRFTQSYVQALDAVEAIGSRSHLTTSEYGLRGICAPGLKLSSFNFTGMTV